MATSLTHIDRVIGSVSGGPALVPRAPSLVSPHIVTSWRRCLTDYGLEPDRVPRTSILTSAELKSVSGSVEDLLVVAVAELRRLLTHLQDTDYILTMTNAEGVVVLARYAASLRGEAETASTVAGSLWSEEHQGTNGIGTCLKEGRPLSVVMDEHFGVRLLGLSCTVAPVLDGNGRLIGVVNVTTPRRSSHDLQAMVCRTVSLSARRIENLLVQRQHAGRRMLRLSRDNDFADLAHEARVVLDDSGRMLAATPGTADLLGIDVTSLIGRPVDEVLDLTHVETAEGHAPFRLPGAEGRAVFARVSSPAPATPGSAPPAPGKLLPRKAVAPVTADEQTRKALRLLQRGLPVLLQGETGSGKSELARALHMAGPRAKQPFIPINCAAIPSELIEGELFGHVPGAYTGASRQGAKGLIRAAHGGTLFLDEIGDMPPHLQSRLLHVLSDGEIVPLGSAKGFRVDVAVISASLHDIADLVRRKQFREDLYFRLNGLTLTLPPLRDRTDRDELVDRILAEEAARAGRAGAVLSDAAAASIRACSWPGNLRELRHAMRYALAMTDGPEIRVDHLPENVSAAIGPGVQADSLERVLLEMNCNVSAAARVLGISRATLHRKIQTSRLRPRHKPL